MGLSLFDLRVVSCAFLFGSILPAQAEVINCNEITAVPATVNASGVWCLKKNLTFAGTTGTAINVTVGPVIIDLNGFTLTGSVNTSNTAIGIHNLNRTNVTIRNGTIRGFADGILVEGASATNNVVEDMHVDRAQHNGINVKHAVRTVVRNNQVTNTGNNVNVSNFGIIAEGAKVTNIINNIVDGVNANNGGSGILTEGSDLTEIRDNSVLNSFGAVSSIGIQAIATNTTIQNNRVLNGATVGSTGIQAGGGVTNCIDNVVHRYSTALGGCSFSSGNITPPNT